MKKLLIIGGGFLQTYVIKKAREMGYEVHVLDGDPKAMGYQFANHYEVIDVKNEEGCLRYAREHQVDGVLTAATDFSVLVVSRVADELLGLDDVEYQKMRESSYALSRKFDIFSNIDKWKELISC